MGQIASSCKGGRGGGGLAAIPVVPAADPKPADVYAVARRRFQLYEQLMNDSYQWYRGVHLRISLPRTGRSFEFTDLECNGRTSIRELVQSAIVRISMMEDPTVVKEDIKDAWLKRNLSVVYDGREISYDGYDGGVVRMLELFRDVGELAATVPEDATGIVAPTEIKPVPPSARLFEVHVKPCTEAERSAKYASRKEKQKRRAAKIYLDDTKMPKVYAKIAVELQRPSPHVVRVSVGVLKNGMDSTRDIVLAVLTHLRAMAAAGSPEVDAEEAAFASETYTDGVLTQVLFAAHNKNLMLLRDGVPIPINYVLYPKLSLHALSILVRPPPPGPSIPVPV